MLACLAMPGALTAIALYSTLIPISLYVSIEVVKYAQAATFIAGDQALYDPVSDTPAAARTSNLNEELGQVGVVLTDKTGTLTANRMLFAKASVGGEVYGAPSKGVAAGAAAAQAPPVLTSPHADPRLAGCAWLSTPAAPALAPFFRALALCHTVIPESVSAEGADSAATPIPTPPSLPTDPHAVRYQAASPDEAALVSAARDAGFALLARPPGAITLLEPITLLDLGESGGAASIPVTYDVLAVLEFSAARRRQSVLLRRRAENGSSSPSSDALLLTKGADTTIEPLLDRDNPPATRHWASTAAHLASFGGTGLRTLCVAGRTVSGPEVEDGLPRFAAARAALQGREAALEAVAESMEVGLHLLGATGIEDRLQDVSVKE